jgi:hypothetical protein
MGISDPSRIIKITERFVGMSVEHMMIEFNVALKIDLKLPNGALVELCTRAVSKLRMLH